MATFFKSSELQEESVVVNLDLVKHIIQDRFAKDSIIFIFDKGHSATWKYENELTREKDLAILRKLAIIAEEHDPFTIG